MEAEKNCHQVVWTLISLISYSTELCNKNCIIKTSKTLIIWSISCSTAEKSGRNKRGANC